MPLQASSHPSFDAKEPRCLLLAVHKTQKHMLHERLLFPPYGGHRQLKSRRPFVPATLDMLNDVDALSTSEAGSWADHKWNTEWQECDLRLHGFIAERRFSAIGNAFPQTRLGQA